jgi:hypothetical protein
LMVSAHKKTGRGAFYLLCHQTTRLNSNRKGS